METHAATEPGHPALSHVSSSQEGTREPWWKLSLQSLRWPGARPVPRAPASLRSPCCRELQEATRRQLLDKCVTPGAAGRVFLLCAPAAPGQPLRGPSRRSVGISRFPVSAPSLSGPRSRLVSRPARSGFSVLVVCRDAAC